MDDAIWLFDPGGAVRRFDLDTLEVSDVLDLDPEDELSGIGGVAADGAIWVSADDVYRIDPGTRKVTDVIPVGLNPERPAYLHGAIWVANHSDRTVSRIDVRTRQVTDTFRMRRTHLHTPLASDGVIWVYTQEGSVHRINEVPAGE